MSKIINKAKEVAESIIQTEEFKKLQITEQDVEEDETASAILEELEAKYEKLRQSPDSGKVNRELQQEVQRVQKKMLENEKLKEYLKAQKEFNQIMQTVNNEIASALGIPQASSRSNIN